LAVAVNPSAAAASDAAVMEVMRRFFMVLPFSSSYDWNRRSHPVRRAQ
jgi:hypothetical protein